jgi:hypothetical protein
MRISARCSPLALAAAPACAEQWFYLAANDTAIVYGDAESVSDYSGYWNVDVIRGFAPADGRSTGFAKLSVEINCGLGRYRINRATTYTYDRQEISTDETTGDWRRFSRNGLSDEVRKFACNMAYFEPASAGSVRGRRGSTGAARLAEAAQRARTDSPARRGWTSGTGRPGVARPGGSRRRRGCGRPWPSSTGCS